MESTESETDVLAETTRKVFIVDDAASTRLILRRVIENVSCLSVAGESGTGQGAIDAATELNPDIILLDLSLPDIPGAAVLLELLQRVPGSKVIILSNNSRIAGPDLVAAGAAGFIEKGLAPFDLVEKLSAVLQTPLTLTPAFRVAGGQ